MGRAVDARLETMTESRYAEVFFFQAEDGIRDVAVTGVQTCALPISEKQVFFGSKAQNHAWLLVLGRNRKAGKVRSEERRVGKESRGRRGSDGCSRHEPAHCTFPSIGDLATHHTSPHIRAASTLLRQL